MTEELLDESMYGKLVWKGFYGPPRNILLLDKFSIKLMIVFPIFLILFGLYWIYFGTNDIKGIFGWVFIVIGVIFPIISLVGRSIKIQLNKSSGFYQLTREGKRDWDLYEDGMNAAFLSETAPTNIERRFIPFDTITRAIITIKYTEMEYLVETLKNRDKNDPDYDPANYVLYKYYKKALRDSIWLFANDSYGIYELDKDNLRDNKRFISILRQKIKSVE